MRTLWPEFVGYYGPLGPVGYIEADTEERVSEVVRGMLAEYPSAMTGEVRYSFFSRKYWITIWVRYNGP